MHQDEGALAGEGLRSVTLRSPSRSTWSSDLRRGSIIEGRSPPSAAGGTAAPSGRPANPAVAAVDSYVESLRRTSEVRLFPTRHSDSNAENRWFLEAAAEFEIQSRDTLQWLARNAEMQFAAAGAWFWLTVAPLPDVVPRFCRTLAHAV